MPYTDNNGINIYYEVAGKGPPIVFCHGLFMSSKVWHTSGYVDLLKEEYQLILIDARGHGLSGKPHDPEAYLIEHRVSDVVSVLDCLGIKRAHFFGYSMGGQVGWCIGRYASDRFMSLIIGGMTPYERNPAIPDSDITFMVPLLEKGNEAFTVALESMFGRKFSSGLREELLRNDSEAIIAHLLRKERVDLDETLLTTSLPVLLFMGELDSGHDAAMGCREVLPNVRFVSLPELNHMQAGRRSDLVVPYLKEFLQHNR
jgi:pimeloyl-ACP methyl ester carboxylesterase